jgi:hypothetical protein
LGIPVTVLGGPKSQGSWLGSWFNGQQRYSEGVTEATKSFGALLASKTELNRLLEAKEDTTKQSEAVRKAHGTFRDNSDAVFFGELGGYEKLVESIGRTYKVDESQVTDYFVGVHTEWDK